MRQGNLAYICDYAEKVEVERARQKLRAQIDEMISQVEAIMSQKEKPPTLGEIVREVAGIRQKITGSIVESLVEQNHQEKIIQKESICPECGRVVPSRSLVEKTVNTLMGEVHLQRPYFYCTDCQRGFYPSDKALQILPGQKQADLQRAATLLTSELPYETASELFKELTGISLSDHTMHEVTNLVGEDLSVLEVCPTSEEIAERIKKVAQQSVRRPIVVLAIDGADAPIRPEEAKGKGVGRKKVRAKRAHWAGEWKEAKGFRFYIVDDNHIIHLISWHKVQSNEGIMEDLEKIKEALLIPEDKVRLCVIADGAPWIWNCVQKIFPSAKQILDYYHCSEHIHRVAQLQYGHNPQKALEWIEATMARLFCNQVHGVIWGLERMKPYNSESKKEIKTCIRYLENHSQRIPYGSLKKGGYPIGSGGIESANKFICHVRLKRSGAWWYTENANHMLALRCAKYNQTFDRVFTRYVEKILASQENKNL
jgi:hypothetical protein